MGTAIVRGAGIGIGAAGAKRLAANGWNVALVGRRAELPDQVSAEIRMSGGHALVVPADLAEPAAVAVIARTAAAFGAIDALVNNAAVIKVLPLADYATEILDQHWAVNIRAAGHPSNE